jgi:hypothetical protein
MPSMMAIMDQLREIRGLAEVELYISQESKVRNGKKSHFNVPKIRFKQSLLEMTEGKGILGAQLGTGTTTMVELGTPDLDNTVIDAEVIE